MTQSFECEGAPRDLGLDQGAACGPAVRAWIRERGIRGARRWLPGLRRLTSGGALGGGSGREVLRHYPHLGERMSGIARASRVSLDALMEALMSSAYASGGDPACAGAVACAAPRDGSGALVLARPLAAGAPWCLRRSRPEVGFESVEVALPWLASGIAGVNEHGLAVALAPAESPLVLRGLGAPPASLLVQECLQRFDSLDGAIAWCRGRPAAGAASVLLADAHGEAASIAFSVHDGARELTRAVGSVVAGGRAESEAALRKRIADAAAVPLTPEDLAATAGPGDLQVWLDPCARSLRLRAPGAAEGLELRAAAESD